MTTWEEPMGGVVDVRCFPAADAEFADAVLSIVAEVLEPVLKQDPGSEVEASRLEGVLASAERRVREAYPNATLRRRDVLAEFGMTTSELWYAFRDGTLR